MNSAGIFLYWFLSLDLLCGLMKKWYLSQGDLTSSGQTGLAAYCCLWPWQGSQKLLRSCLCYYFGGLFCFLGFLEFGTAVNMWGEKDQLHTLCINTAWKWERKTREKRKRAVWVEKIKDNQFPSETFSLFKIKIKRLFRCVPNPKHCIQVRSCVCGWL